MSKTRQRATRRFPDGPVWVRTYPLTLLQHDHSSRPHRHDWHQLTCAARGHIEVETDAAHWSVPSDRALWIPAGTEHREVMRAPVSVRMLYIAPGVARWPADCHAMLISPLLRELIAHASSLGALDRSEPAQRRVIGVLVDQLRTAPPAALSMPLPRDPRARRLATAIARAPDRPLAGLAREAGASLRTLERLFVAETGLSLGQWRRQRRLFGAFELLERGAPVAAAADAAGYATLSAFSAAFRRQFGAPPRRLHPIAVRR